MEKAKSYAEEDGELVCSQIMEEVSLQNSF